MTKTENTSSSQPPTQDPAANNPQPPTAGPAAPAPRRPWLALLRIALGALFRFLLGRRKPDAN